MDEAYFLITNIKMRCKGLQVLDAITQFRNEQLTTFKIPDGRNKSEHYLAWLEESIIMPKQTHPGFISQTKKRSL